MPMRPHEINEPAVAFDAREAWLSMDDLWDPERRREFLIRDSVHKPLSVDVRVWPTIFDVGGVLPLRTLDPTLTDFQELPVPCEAWQDSYPFCPNLDTLLQTVAERWRFPDKRVAFIAIATPQNEPFPTGRCPRLSRYLSSGKLADNKYEFLGFDVVDQGMISGLMDCGYTKAEVREARRRWGTLLNQHHLFTDVDAAIEFSEWTSERVPEHAPFCVVGLYLLGYFFRRRMIGV
ncbi:MAG: hypothetical protein GXP27_13950 [Planctomycetes bacterium]|nr:hypothetical protein [Planctomycetota bacterium]